MDSDIANHDQYMKCKYKMDQYSSINAGTKLVLETKYKDTVEVMKRTVVVTSKMNIE